MLLKGMGLEDIRCQVRKSEFGFGADRQGGQNPSRLPSQDHSTAGAMTTITGPRETLHGQ